MPTPQNTKSYIPAADGLSCLPQKMEKEKFYCRWMSMSIPQNTKSYIPAVGGPSFLPQKMEKEKILL